MRVRYVFRPIRSVFIDEKKLSIAALSQTLPDRLIEQVTPSWNCSLVYWLPFRVMQQGVRLSPDRHHQRIGHELSGHGVAHRPSDRTAREQVDHDGDIEPSLSGPDVGEVCDPPLVGRLGGELAVENVVGNDRPQTIVLGQATTSRTRPQALHTHQPFDAMQTT